MRLLLDSHSVLWATMGDDRLPRAVRDLVADPRHRILMSVATTWELTMKALVRRLELPEPPAPYFEGLVRDFGYEVLPIYQRHVDALAELPAIHDDPFDRMLVAQALVEDLDLVTGDETLRAYPVPTIW